MSDAPPNRQRIGPRPETTPAETGVSRGQLTAIPYDLLQEASRRLGILSLLAAALWIVATAVYHLVPRQVNHGDSLDIQQLSEILAVIAVTVSLALFAYTRRQGANPRFILDLGLGYTVFSAFLLGLIAHWDHAPSGTPIKPMVSWTAAVILIFAAIVPNSPVKVLIAGLIAASMNPLSMLIAKARGVWEFGDASNVLVMHFPDYLLVGAAVVISHVVTRLGRQVSKAREMGSYQLVRLLGKGGMGEVWQAHHRMLARDSAIKLIQPDLLNRVSEKNAVMMQRRFEQEARATALLRSPHTVELYDFGVTENGVFYYVMEMLNGIDLATLVKTFGPQPPARVVHIVSQVCRSLSEAHTHQLIHRDIKPTNIFLCRMGNEYDFAKVLDFGLVKAIDTKNDEQKTLAGATTGTPAYMAPEVALGREQIDGRSDLYGLGCVAYWLLTGKLVFENDNATALLLAHVQAVPIRPSERTAISVPESLERLVMMCLAKKPAARPVSADALAHELQRCDGLGTWTAEDAKQWWLKNVPDGVPSPTEREPSTLTQSISGISETAAF